MSYLHLFIFLSKVSFGKVGLWSNPFNSTKWQSSISSCYGWVTFIFTWYNVKSKMQNIPSKGSSHEGGEKYLEQELLDTFALHSSPCGKFYPSIWVQNRIALNITIVLVFVYFEWLYDSSVCIILQVYMPHFLSWFLIIATRVTCKIIILVLIPHL